MNDALKQVLDRQLSSLAWDNARSQDVLRQVRGETKVKKKLSVGLVMALTLMLVAIVAVAAITISRSSEAQAATQARQALADRYGLTPDTLGVFYMDKAQEGDTWTFTFSGEGLPGFLVGDYKVVLKKGEAPIASWTHDEADQALLDSGSLDSPVWGAKQIKTALMDTEARYTAIQEHIKASPEKVTYFERPYPSPPADGTQKGEYYWYGELWKEGVPGPDMLTEAQALEIAKAALMDEFSLSQEDMDRAERTDSFFREETNSKGAVWSFHLYVVVDGVELGLNAVLDAITGEVQHLNITTGGNG